MVFLTGFKFALKSVDNECLVFLKTNQTKTNWKMQKNTEQKTMLG